MKTITNKIALYIFFILAAASMTANGEVKFGNSADTTIAADSILPVPVSISGPTFICPNAMTNVVYTTPAIEGATSYTWYVTSAATIISGQGTNTLTVSYSSTLTTAHIFVGTNNDSTSSMTYGIEVKKTPFPLTPGPLQGPVLLCGLDTAYYSVALLSNVTSYNWTVPTGITIISGQGTNHIGVSIDSSFRTGNISVTASNYCRTSSARVLGITNSPVVPLAIAGPKNACSFMASGSVTTYSIAPVAHASSYNWTVPANASIVSGHGTSSIQVSYSTAFVSGNISVSSVGACGASKTRTLTITRTLPAIPGVITGATNVCSYLGTANNVTYSIAPAANAASYNWTVPANATIVSGQGTTSIQVNYSSAFLNGNITVSSVGSCATSSPRALSVKKLLPLTPSPIAGPTNAGPYAGTGCNVIYQIAGTANAQSYYWTVPDHASIISGQGTTYISVSFDASFSSGNITVSSVANCATSTARTLAITKTKPAKPGLISGLTTLCGDTVAVYSVPLQADAPLFSWVAPEGMSILSGQGTNSISVAVSAGFTGGYVGVSAYNPCGVSDVRMVLVSECQNKHANINNPAEENNADEQDINEKKILFNLYPNPAKDLFNIELKSGSDKQILIEVYDMTGKLVASEQQTTEGYATTLQIRMEEQQNGIYEVRITDVISGNRKSERLVKQ